MPRPVIAVAVLATAVVTAWAMWQTGMDGPHAAWHQADGTVSQVWGAEAGVHPAAGAWPVAGVAGAPAIPFAASPPHADRGACTGCHAVITAAGTPVPSITSTARSPHGLRGVCTNCHRLHVGP